MMSKSSKIMSKWCLEIGLDSSAKKVRKLDPPEPSQEGSRSSESTVFTFSLFLQKVSKKVPKSSQNGGPRLSKSSPESVSKNDKMSIDFVLLWGVQNGAQKHPKNLQKKQQIITNRSKINPCAQRVPLRPLRGHFGRPGSHFGGQNGHLQFQSLPYKPVPNLGGNFLD